MSSLMTKLRLPLILALLGVVVTSLAVAAEYIWLKPLLRSAVHAKLSGAAEHLAERLDQGMFERWQDIMSGAKRQVLRERSGSAEREVVDEIKARHPRYAWVGFTDEACIVRVSTEKSLDGMNVEARPWCSEARRGPFVGDIHEAVLLKSRLKDIGRIGLLMDIAAPVRGPDQTVSGVLAAHLAADWLMDAASAASAATRVETAIITSQGQTVTASGLQGGSVSENTRRSAPQGVRRDGDFLSVAVATKGSGDFPGFGWTAVARLRETDADEDFHRTVMWTLIGGAALSGLLFGAGYLVRGAPPPHAGRPTVPVRSGTE